MAAPEYVPVSPTANPRLEWVSSPRVPDSWLADRPADFPRESQPLGPRLGNPGPDIGYAYKLANRFHDRLELAAGERRHDVVSGCLQVAMKRAALFGRAPVVHDLTVAFTVWGYLDADPPRELVETRRPAFAEVSHPFQYMRRRAVADAVPPETLQKVPAAVTREHAADWRSLLDLSALPNPGS